MKKLDVNDCRFAHLTLELLLHYLVKCRSCSLAVDNDEFILGSQIFLKSADVLQTDL